MMTRTKDLFLKPARAVLISIHPRFVEKILSGEKRLEFRRSWAIEPVEVLVIYSTSPVKKIVASVEVLGIVKGSPTALWDLAKEKGGGVTRQLIYEYFEGKKTGFAIEMGSVRKFANPVDPKNALNNFYAPQSFRYLDMKDYEKILEKSEGRIE